MNDNTQVNQPVSNGSAGEDHESCCEDCRVLRSGFESCEKEKAEYLLGWQRAKADYANYKKDEAERVESMIKFGLSALLKEFLSVMDSFDLARASLSGNDGASKGVLMIQSQLEDILKKYGLVKFHVLPGESFDPLKHEAMQETVSSESPGKISGEISPGFMLYDRVIRPARVTISKGNNDLEAG